MLNGSKQVTVGKVIPVDLGRIREYPSLYVNEDVYAAIRGCSARTIQRERNEKRGCPFVKVGPRHVRYRVADIFTFMESFNAPQARRGRPSKRELVQKGAA